MLQRLLIHQLSTLVSVLCRRVGSIRQRTGRDDNQDGVVVNGPARMHVMSTCNSDTAMTLSNHLICTLLLPLTLILTFLWGRCGRHNSPPANSVMDFVGCCLIALIMSPLKQSTHLCFRIPLLILTGGTISVVYLPTYTWSRLSRVQTISVLFSFTSL